MFFARLRLPAHFSNNDVRSLSAAFEDLSQGSVSRREDHDDEKPWILEWYFEEKPDAACLTTRCSIQDALGLSHPLNLHNTDFEIGEVVQENWLEKVYQEHQPFSVGPFFIYGSHYDGKVPQGQIGLLIDAATAFGSGDHGTTKGCLQAMLDLKAKGQCPWNVLDMGTGSGILAIAAWKLWQTPITAIDIDEESVRVAKRYQTINGVKEGKGAMQCGSGDGFQTPLCQSRAPYDLIIANILAGPLVEMAEEMVKVSDHNSYIILSGMLRTQADTVLKAYTDLGLTLNNRFDIEKWSTLVLHKK